MHRFKIIENPTRNCDTKDHRLDQFLFECELLNKQRDILNSAVLKTVVGSIIKNKLIRKHFKISAIFTKEISFPKINEVLNPSNQPS